MILFLIVCSATAEEEAILNALPMEELQQFATEQNVDLRTWIAKGISGEFTITESLDSILHQLRAQLLGDFRSIASVLLVPSAALLVLKLMLPSGGSSRKASSFVCRVSCISALAAAFVQMRQTAEQLMRLLLRCSEVLTPVMFAAVTLAGGETATLLLNPMAALCTELIQNLLAHWGIAVASAAAVFAVAGNLSENLSLKRLHDLLRQLVNWGTGAMMAGFLAILSIQGRLSAGRDSIAARSAKYAIEGMIPVIGGNVSDSLDALLSTASVVKNAIGVSGLALIALVCAAPLLRLLAFSLLLKLFSAITEPLGDDSITAIMAQFANCIEMLLVIALAAGVLCSLLVGSCMSAAANVVR